MIDFESFLKKCSKPAQRAILNKGLKSLEEISTLTEEEFLSLHGIGRKTLPVVEAAFQEVGLSFKK